MDVLAWERLFWTNVRKNVKQKSNQDVPRVNINVWWGVVSQNCGEGADQMPVALGNMVLKALLLRYFWMRL